MLGVTNLCYWAVANFVLDSQLLYGYKLGDGLLLLDGLLVVALAYVYYREQRPEAVNDEDAEFWSGPLPIPPSPQNDYLRMVEHFPHFLCLKDGEGHWLRASRHYLGSLNLQDVDYVGKTDNGLLTHYPQGDARALRLASIQDKSAWHLRRQVKETRIIPSRNNSKQTLEIIRTPVFDAMQNRLYLIITGHFIEQTEKANTEQIVQAFQMSYLCFLFLDAEFRISQANPAFTRLTGHLFEDMDGQLLSAIIVGELDLTPARFFKSEAPIPWSAELSCQHKNGHVFPVRLDIVAVPQGEGQDTGYFATLLDITEQKKAESYAEQIANYDELTGLVNRGVFFSRLNQFLSAAKQHHGHAVIFFIDLDRFKAIKDSLGHDAGNLLLKETADRLLSVMSDGDVVARLRGEEFALLMLNQPTHDQALYSASMIAAEIIHKLSSVFYIHNREVFIGASMGLAIYPEDGMSADMLLKNADIAMYEAKKQGPNNYQFYKKDYAAASHDRFLMELNLRKALERGELQLYYQPQYYAGSRKNAGAEVLIRWFHGAAGQVQMISPDKFIPIAEESGLIVAIGEWILRTACQQMKKWLEAGYSLQQVSVNVSARQFTDNNFLQSVESALSAVQLDARHLELEITESMLVGDIRQIELQLNRLKKMGIKIALDDFGTGYSSLSYLKSFPIDVLKIDQSFIREMTVGSKDARLVSAIIEMGHSLGQKIVAEGVETEQQLEYLAHRDCDIIQGYFFSKPLPMQAMTDLLAKEAQFCTASGKSQSVPFLQIDKAQF
jgi:diguanylate cyclase (GGDEF)-like protein/PAS domain S-box-containing protein